jgi:hypothetical protein
VFDRSFGRYRSIRKGERQLADQAEQASEE